MELHRSLKIRPAARIVALVGGGGKTTSLLALAAEAAASGLRAAVMTTTHLGQPKRSGFYLLLSGDRDEARQAWRQGLVVATGQLAPDGRLLQPEQETWDFLLQEAEAIYVEADGSRMLPLKYPGAWEPALPEEYDQVLLLTGLSALDKPVDDFCHRAALMRQELGVTQSVIDEELMARVLAAGYGRFDPTVIINQADTEELAARGRKLARCLAELGLRDSAVLSLHRLLGYPIKNGGLL